MTARHWIVTVGVALGLAAGNALGQSADEARKLLDGGQWKPAAAAYARIVDADPKNADAWFRLGIAQRGLERYAEATASIQRALANGFNPTQGYAALGFTRALAGDPTGAFEALDRAVEEGLPGQVLDTHPAAAPLRPDPRFAALRKKAEERSHPCATGARYRAFDFWVGDWDVFAADKQVGHNRIERILGGCALQENWTDLYGDTGRSLNYYDPASGKWKQNWVDENGGLVWYEGEVRDGEMLFHGENIAADGRKLLARVRLGPLTDGTVHHVIEHSKDGGKTWAVAFDAVYRPAKKDGPR
jgi:tetratricopeptide (TPR) repeat protein